MTTGITPRPGTPKADSRLWSERGFGLIELLIALTVTSIAIMALVATLSTSHVTLVRASRISTSAAIASKQLESYRRVKHTDIRLDTAAVSAADSIYTGDAAYAPVPANRVTATCPSPVPDICLPTRTVTGADGRSYRVDTYIVWTTPAGGSAVKQITVVVRKTGSVGALARVVSTAGTDF